MRLSEDEREVVNRLWHEYVVSRLLSTRSGLMLLEMVVGIDSFEFAPPYAFMAYELGLKQGHGPSIFDIAKDLREDNEARIRHFQNAELKRERALGKLRPSRRRSRKSLLSERRRSDERDWLPNDPNGNNRERQRAERAEERREDLKRVRKLSPESRRRKKRAVAKRAGIVVHEGRASRVEE